MNRLPAGLWFPLLLAAFVCAPGPARAEPPPARVFTEELPPYNFTEGVETRGIATDLLLAAARRAGIELRREDIAVMPWPRALDAAQATPGSILYSTARTEAREPLFRWVGPIDRLTIGLIAPKRRGIVIRAPADLGPLVIGTVRDGAPEQLIIAAGADPDRLDRISDARQNLRKLAAGRIDAFPFLVPTAHYLMAKEGMDPDDYEVVLPLKTLDLYYALHPKSDDALVRALQAGLDEIKRPAPDGVSEYDRILRAYLTP